MTGTAGAGTTATTAIARGLSPLRFRVRANEPGHWGSNKGGLYVRRLVTVLLTGGLVVSLGAPAVAGAHERSKDDKITAQRDSDGRRSGYSHPDDEDYRKHFRRDRRYRNGYSGDSSGDPGYDRRARKREQECEDSYTYDPSFYNRYCRSAYSDRSGSQPAPQTQSPSPDSTTPGDNPAPDANQQPGPDQSPPPTGHQHGTPDGSTPPDAAAPPPADSQPAPAPSQRSGAPSSDRRDDRTPAWAGYATAPAGPAGPAQPAGGSF